MEDFSRKLQLELARAERYRVFVSMILLDLSEVEAGETGSDEIVNETVELIRNNVRLVDDVSRIDAHRIGLLCPETPRQGAEITSRRITELVKKYLEGKKLGNAAEKLSLEMISYPDAAGTRTLSDFLSEIAAPGPN